MRSRLTAFAHVLILVALTAPAQAQRAIILVRHADKETDPKIVRGLDDDQIPLSEAGRTRALALSDRLKDSGVGAIYTSGSLRTKKTAGPIADALGIEPKELDTAPEALAHLGETLRGEHGDHVVLIVGHSNTVPQIIDRLMGRSSEIAIGDDQFDRLFILVPKADGAWGLIRSRY